MDVVCDAPSHCVDEVEGSLSLVSRSSSSQHFRLVFVTNTSLRIPSDTRRRGTCLLFAEEMNDMVDIC